MPNVFIDNEAAPGGNGSSDAPYNTIQAALAASTGLSSPIVFKIKGNAAGTTYRLYIQDCSTSTGYNGKALTFEPWNTGELVEWHHNASDGGTLGGTTLLINHLHPGTTTINSIRFRTIEAETVGGNDIDCVGGAVVLNNCILSSSATAGARAVCKVGINCYGVTFNNCEISRVFQGDNTAWRCLSSVMSSASYGALTLNNTSIECLGSTMGAAGAAIYLIGSMQSLTIRGNSVIQNMMGRGAAIESTMTLVGLTIGHADDPAHPIIESNGESVISCNNQGSTTFALNYGTIRQTGTNATSCAIRYVNVSRQVSPVIGANFFLVGGPGAGIRVVSGTMPALTLNGVIVGNPAVEVAAGATITSCVAAGAAFEGAGLAILANGTIGTLTLSGGNTFDGNPKMGVGVPGKAAPSASSRFLDLRSK